MTYPSLICFVCLVFIRTIQRTSENGRIKVNLVLWLGDWKLWNTDNTDLFISKIYTIEKHKTGQEANSRL